MQFAIDKHSAASGVRSAVICPGFVDTDVAPAFFRVFRHFIVYLRCGCPMLLCWLGFLPFTCCRVAPFHWWHRPVAHNFQVTPARGSSILLHVAAMPSTELASGRKYVMKRGYVSVAQNGATDPDPALAEQVYQYCDKIVSAAGKTLLK